MPTKLPLHPNLQHLKKQAKALLRDFHQGRPDAIEKFTALRLNVPPKLSDAQYLVARDYGFDSWSKLKERVESLAEKADDPLELAKKAFREDDAATVRQLLKRHPKLGYRYEAEESREVRILLYGHYRIAYLIKSESSIDILGVFHGALSIERYLV